MRDQAALIVIDVQPDFMPGGALACHDGKSIVAGIERLLQAHLFHHVVATQDWHPPNHISFAATHPGKKPFECMMLYGQEHTLWPTHCVQRTSGAELDPAIDWSHVNAIIRKGYNPLVDSYSGFRENTGPQGERVSTGLAGWLRERGVDEVYLCGLARDVCVLWTAEDAIESGFRTAVVWDLTRPTRPNTDAATRARLHRLGVTVLQEADLYRESETPTPTT